MKDKFFSGVKYRIGAVNQERLFNGLSKKVKLYHIKRVSQTEAEIFVKPSSQKFFENEISKKNIKILSKKNTFMFYFFKAFIQKTGVIAGLIFAFALLIVSNHFVLQTKVLGLEKIKENEIVEVLKQENAVGIVLKASVNTKKLETAITKKFDSISLVSVIVKGNTLLVSVKEKISAGEYDNPETFKPLTAKYNGLITEINLISGTVKVKVGQLVKVGDVLVEPYILDSSGNTRVVKADAEISARVWITAKETHFENRVEIVRTGKKTRYTNFYFVKLALNKANNQIPYYNYEIETKTRFVAENNILPIVREEIVVYETTKKEIIEPFETVKEKLFEKAKQKALQMLEEYDIIKKEYSNVNTSFGVVNVEYVIEINKLIN